MATNYRRRQIAEGIGQWHMSNSHSIPPCRYFTEQQFIGSVAGAFLAGAFVAVFVLVMLSMGAK